MDKLQKVYVYILAGRYRPDLYIQTFIDIRKSVLEILYSFVVVVPHQFKHTYGLDPYQEIEKSIDDFTVVSRTMMEILYSYAKANGYNIADNYFHPYEENRENLLP
jgi:hypothetical protein